MIAAIKSRRFGGASSCPSDDRHGWGSLPLPPSGSGVNSPRRITALRSTPPADWRLTERRALGSSVAELKHVLVWCVVINYAILLLWFCLFVYAHEWWYRMQGHWFRLSRETFDALNWAGIGLYKLGILLLNLVPLVALCLSYPSAR